MRTRLPWVLLLALACAPAPSPTIDSPPTVDSPATIAEAPPPTEPDPCDAVPAFEVATERAELALGEGAFERFADAARALSEATACDGSLAALERAGPLLADMGELQFASDPEAGRELFHAAFLVHADLAERSPDPSVAAWAADRQYTLLDRVLFFEPQQPSAPILRTCKTNSRGTCVYRDKKSKKKTTAATSKPKPKPKPKTTEQPEHVHPYTPRQRDLLRAYTIYLQFGDDPDRVEALTYLRFRQLGAHQDLDGSRDELAAFIEAHDGDELSAWAAAILLDDLAHRALADELSTPEELSALATWARRLPTMQLWTLPEAEPVRALVPIVLAGALWRLGIAARERGDFDGCAERFAEIRERFRDHDRADAVYIHWSSCLADAMRLDEAIAIRRQLVTSLPDSEYAIDARWDLGVFLWTIGRYAEAASELLSFAEQARWRTTYSDVPHIGDAQKWTPNLDRDTALIIAHALATGLGDQKATARARDLFARRDPRQSRTRSEAVDSWAIRPASGRALEDYARHHLEVFADVWPEGKLEVHLALGQEMWRRACRGRLEAGVCVDRPSRPTRGCSLSGRSSPKPRARRRRDLDRALDEFRWVLAHAGEETPTAIIVGARLGLLEAQFEGYLVDAQGPDAPTLATAYRELASEAEPERAVLAWARIAAIWERQANQGLRRPTSKDACQPIDANTEAAIERATTAYQTCLDLATQTGEFDTIARRCEAAATTIDPVQTPPLRELVGGPTPTSTGASPIRAGVQPPPRPSSPPSILLCETSDC